MIENRSNKNKKISDLIVNSKLFDNEYYKKTSGVTGSRAELVKHYIAEGEAAGFAPSEDFDPQFYALCYPDVEEAGVNKLAHYIEFGQSEHRYRTSEQLKGEGEIVLDSDFFDSSYCKNYSERIMIPGISLCEEQLVLARIGLKPNSWFDPVFYAELYPDVREADISPTCHYLTIGRAQNRITNVDEYDARYSLLAAHLDRRFYASYDPRTLQSADLVRHYISEGSFKGWDIMPDFSIKYYLRAYPDIQEAKIDPLLHYLKHGMSEGRVGRPNFKAAIEAGDVEFDKDKPTIAIANHEASRTGAPLVGLNLAKALSQRYNVITILGRLHDLTDPFFKCSTSVVVGNFSETDGEYLLVYLKEKFEVSAIILNSVETSALATSAAWANVPTVALIHEFSEYTKPAGRIAGLVRSADVVVVPARIIERSLQAEVMFHNSTEAPNVEIHMQGALPWLPSKKEEADFSADDIREYFRKCAPHKKHFVLGAGHIGIRKGVDLFIETAKAVSKIRNDVAFIWVGGGYDPERDYQYSMWLREMVNRMDLMDTVHFMAPQSSLSAFYEVCGIFMLSSRLDPFPNVVVDALTADRYVVCFEDATGSADLFSERGFQGIAVPYCNTSAAAVAILDAIENPMEPGVNAGLAVTAFDFAQYVDFIDEKLRQAIASRAKIEDAVKDMAEKALFDPVYYSAMHLGSEIETQLLRDYALASSKGMSGRNPCRGFSENLYFTRHPKQQGIAALDAAERDSGGDAASIATHRAIEIGKASLRALRSPSKLKTLLHVHAHYAEEFEEIVTRLNRAKVELDLLVTTTSEKSLRLIDYLLMQYQWGDTFTKLNKNIGRDIGPFLTDGAAVATAGGYEIVGHLHTKRSVAAGGQVGTLWKNYLFDTLLGDGQPLKDILHLFADNEKLGLVFPEDGHCVGWSSNLEFARTLARRFRPKLNVPARPVFPIGNMFWARVNAVRPLWDLGLTSEDLPSEPLPYDGSLLHAIERLSPAICEYAGYEWATVWVDGVVR